MYVFYRSQLTYAVHACAQCKFACWRAQYEINFTAGGGIDIRYASAGMADDRRARCYYR
eukprot:COSAG05_NODE_122_length_17611_cov_47.044655_8_plen_59_part_00